MFDLAPKLRKIAASVAIASGAVLFTVTPVLAQTAGPVSSFSSLPILEHVTSAVG